MNVTRRGFLAATGALALEVVRSGGLLAEIERRTPPPAAKPATWPGVKASFGLDPRYRHFASFFIASHPKPVRDAIEAHRRALDENPFLTVERGLFESEAQNVQLKVLADIAPYLGAKPDEIALTQNTTTGLALVYAGLALKPGDEVLVTTHDHYVHHECVRMLVERSGASARRVALYDRAAEASSGTIAERLRGAIGPRTRVVGVTWVHSSTGVRLPLRAIGEVVAAANRGRDEADRILLVVDGVHGLGAVDETIAETGCDFFSAGTHKWMFAPRGTGLLWGRPSAWARIRPTIPSFSDLGVYEAWMRGESPTGPNTAGRTTPGGFQAYDHQWSVGAAFRWHELLGKARVAARIRELNARCREGLAATKGVTVHTPKDPELSAGLLAFEVNGLKPEQTVARLLERRIVASTSPYAVSYARLAPSLVNDEADVDAAIRELRSIATT